VAWAVVAVAADLREARDRLNQEPENSSRPPSCRAPWESQGGGRESDEGYLTIQKLIWTRIGYGIDHSFEKSLTSARITILLVCLWFFHKSSLDNLEIVSSMKSHLSLLSLLLALSVPVFAADAAKIKVEKAWAWESPPTVTNGAAYMTVVNTGKETDRIVGASGDVSGIVELHTHLMEGGMMKMRPVEAIEVRPGEPTVLRPGGLHIMLIELKKPLIAGQTFPLRLHFEKAGEIPVEVTVHKMDEKGSTEHKHHSDKHAH